MEHLVTDKEFDETLTYYRSKYESLTSGPAAFSLPPAAACVVLLVGIIDTALRVVFSEEDEMLEDFNERLTALEDEKKP